MGKELLIGLVVYRGYCVLVDGSSAHYCGCVAYDSLAMAAC